MLTDLARASVARNLRAECSPSRRDGTPIGLAFAEITSSTENSPRRGESAEGRIMVGERERERGISVSPIRDTINITKSWDNVKIQEDYF